MNLLDKFHFKDKNGIQTTMEICDSFSRNEINELNSELNLKQNIADNTLSTTNKNIVGAINEINSDLTDITNKLSFKDIQNIRFDWYGTAGQQRLEIIATLYPANVLVMVQFNYDNTIKMFQSSDGGSTWQNIWAK